MKSQSVTDQKVVLLLPLGKKLNESQGTCPYPLHVKVKSLNLASRNTQLHHREAILQGQRRDKRALNFPNTKFKSKFEKQNSNLGSRKLADHFGIGKTQIQTILRKQGGDYTWVCQQ